MPLTKSPQPLLRDLRRQLLLEITRGEKRVASEQEVRSWILDRYKNNHVSGDIYRSLLLIPEDLVMIESELPSLEENLKHRIKLLEDRPLPKHCFLSLTLNNDTHLGVLIQKDRLQIDGLVYDITFFDPDDKLNKVIKVEIRACQKEAEPFASIFTNDGWVAYSIEDFTQLEQLSLAVKCLLAYHRYKYPVLPITSVKVSRDFSPPPKPNDYLIELLANAYQNLVVCTKAIVPLSLIEPEDIDFALNYSNEHIKYFMSLFAGDALPELVLYEKEGKLIMGDDYGSYLAYKALLYKDVPAVIVGPYLQPAVKVIKQGRSELIPPIQAANIRNTDARMGKGKKKLLDTKLAELTPRVNPSHKLEGVFIQFCKLLSSHRTKESDLHNFIRGNSSILDSHSAALLSEVKIGRFRADLVLRYDQLDKRILLIELERQSDAIFNKRNRLKSKVTHACQQVEDWISEIRSNATGVPKWLDRSYTAEGLVVVGRRTDLSEEQQEILFNINANRIVKIITYDDLLERLKRLIVMLDGLNSERRLDAA